MLITTSNEGETRSLGQLIGRNLKPGDILCLEGDLGVGKTAISKGIAEGLQVTEEITSPTFTIVNEYSGEVPFYHFDVYRIQEVYEMDEIGYETYFFGEGVCLIEWASIIEEIVPMEAIWITIQKDLDQGFDYRDIRVEGYGERFEELSKVLEEYAVKGE